MPASARGASVLTQFTCPVAASGSYRLIFHVATTNAAAWDLWLDRVYCGNGQLVQGAAVQKSTKFTPVTTNFGTIANDSMYYRRSGDTVEISGYFQAGTTQAATSTFAIPNSLTASSIISGNTVVGQWWTTSAAGTVVKRGVVTVAPGSSTSLLYFSQDDYTNSAGVTIYSQCNGNVISANSLYINIRASFPVNEWSANVYFGNEQVIYAASAAGGSEAGWDAAGAVGDTVIGETGAVISGALGANRTKRVRFPQSVKHVRLQYQRNGMWINQEDSECPNIQMAATSMGARVQPVTSSTTDWDVIFSSKAIAGSTWNSATGTGDWSSVLTARWRLVGSTVPYQAGFNVATTSQPVGLLQAGAIPGVTSGVAASAGYVGEYKEAVQSSGIAATSGSPGWGDIDPGVSSWGGTGATGLVLSAGEWDLQGVGRFSLAGSTTTTYMDLAIGTEVRSSTTGIDILRNEVVMNGSSQVLSNQGSFVLSTPVWRVKISSQTTYYLKANLVQSGGSVTVFGILSARRVR